MKDHNSDIPADLTEDSHESKRLANNHISLKVALPVLGTLLILVGITAGAFLSQQPKLTTSSRASCPPAPPSCSVRSACTRPDGVVVRAAAYKTCNSSPVYECCREEKNGCELLTGWDVHCNPIYSPPGSNYYCLTSLLDCNSTPSVPTITPTIPLTIPPTKSPTPPKITPTNSPTPTPPITGCVNWGINERSTNSASDVVKFDSSLKTMSFVRTHSKATDGLFNIEAMDLDRTTNTVYVVVNSKHGLYKLNSDGSLTLKVNLSPTIYIGDISFRKSDNTLWAWSKGKGLYTINPTTGAMTLILSSLLDNVEGLTWDNSSQYLYLSRTSRGFLLYRYDPVGRVLSQFAKLPGDTDDLDTRLNDGLIMGAYKSSGGVTFYSFDPVKQAVVSRYPISTGYGNVDAFSICN